MGYPALKRIGVIFALWIGFALALNSNLIAIEKKEVILEKLPKLVADSVVYDFGEVWSGESMKHAFVLENKGEGDLEIKRVSPG